MNEFRSLLTPKEAAEALGCGQGVLLAHVRSGALRYIDVGAGKQRIRRMFDPADLAAFVESKRRIESPPACQSKSAMARRFTTTNLNAEVIGFTARAKLLTESAQKK